VEQATFMVTLLVDDQEVDSNQAVLMVKASK
jgi:hypothetical protein